MSRVTQGLQQVGCDDCGHEHAEVERRNVAQFAVTCTGCGSIVVWSEDRLREEVNA